MSAKQPHAGDWLLAPSITAVGLQISDEEIRLSSGLRLGARLCQPHTCDCGAMVDSLGIYELSCRKNVGRQIRHSTINDIIWRAMRRASIPSMKEPLGLLRDDGKRLDGVTLIPWARGRCLAWDVTVSDTFAATHLPLTSLTPSKPRRRKRLSISYLHKHISSRTSPSKLLEHSMLKSYNFCRKLREDAQRRRETWRRWPICFSKFK